MNKVLSLVAFLLVVSYSSYGQSAGHGLKIGFNRLGNAEHKFEMVNKQSFKRESLGFGGFVAGMFINQIASENFWIKHEILYVNKGYRYSDTLANGSMETLKVRLHYLEIYPLLAALNIKGFQVFAGPMASFYLGKRAEYLGKNDAVNIEKGVEYDESPRNLIEGGFVAGIEYESKPGINIGIRLTQCLISSKHPANEDLSCSNHSLVFVVGYTILKKKKEEMTYE